MLQHESCQHRYHAIAIKVAVFERVQKVSNPLDLFCSWRMGHLTVMSMFNAAVTE